MISKTILINDICMWRGPDGIFGTGTAESFVLEALWFFFSKQDTFIGIGSHRLNYRGFLTSRCDFSVNKATLNVLPWPY